MKLYWPMAITTDGEKLFTYEPALTEEGAIRQIDFWKNEYGFQIERAWVDEKEGAHHD